MYPGDKWTANSLQTFCDVVLHVTNSQAAAAAAAAATLDDYDDTVAYDDQKGEQQQQQQHDADVTVTDNREGDNANDTHTHLEGNGKKNDLIKERNADVLGNDEKETKVEGLAKQQAEDSVKDELETTLQS